MKSESETDALCAAGHIIIKDVLYGEHSKRHRLDIYRPRPSSSHQTLSKGPIPVVIHVHGGGWQRGSKNDRWRGGPSAGEAFSSANCVSVVISYRLAPPSIFASMFRAVMLSLVLSGLIKLLCWLFGWLPTLTYGELLGFYVFPIITLISVIHLIATTFISSLGFSRHPHQIQDVADSIRWVRDNIGEHCPEVLRPGERQPCGVFLSGHSAGAHLISLLMCEPKYLNQVGVPFDFVLGVMAISGVYTMTGPIGDNSILNFMFRHSYGASAVGLFDERALYEASPINFVHSRLPPFVVLSASSDYGLEVDSQRWVAKLSEHQVPTEYHVIPNTGHASVTQLHRNGALPILSTFVHKHHAIASSSRPINRVDK